LIKRRQQEEPLGTGFHEARRPRGHSPFAIGHVRADLIARYNKDEAWAGRSDAFAPVRHIATPIGARAPGAAVVPLRG
jgi:hypothetical protein